TRKYLNETQYEVLEAKNATEAKNLLKKEKIELVILDINLRTDNENGIQLAETINEKYFTPFIFLTAYETSEMIQKAISTRPSSYLTKPFKRIDLISSIEIALNQSAQFKQKPYIIVRDEDYHTKLQFDDIE